MSRTGTRQRPKNRTVKEEPDLLAIDEAFGKAMEKERPRRRRTVEDFERDVAELRRKRGSAS